MPDKAAGPKFTSGPPRSGRAPKASAAVPPPDAPEEIGSTEPDDDLSDYLVKDEPPTAPEPEPEAPRTVAAPPQAKTVTTADTELVLRLERELAAARARLEGKNADVAAWPVEEAPQQFQDGDVVLIHIREDGFTACGRVWFRGQELEFTVGEQNWRDSLSRDGKSWLMMSESDQLRRYGKVMFGRGPWPGAAWDNDRAAAAEQRRGRQAPTIPQITNLALDERS